MRCFQTYRGSHTYGKVKVVSVLSWVVVVVVVVLLNLIIV